MFNFPKVFFFSIGDYDEYFVEVLFLSPLYVRGYIYFHEMCIIVVEAFCVAGKEWLKHNQILEVHSNQVGN